MSKWNISNWGKNSLYGPQMMFDNSGITQENHEKALIRFAAHDSDPDLILPENIDLGNIPVAVCSEMEVNCTHCYTDDGFCGGPFSPSLRLSFETPFADTEIDFFGGSIIYFMAPQRFEEGFRMPLIGTTIADDEGVAQVKEYIESLHRGMAHLRSVPYLYMSDLL